RVAVDINLDQAGGVDLLVEHAVGIEQKLVGRSRYPAGDMVGDHLGHSVHRGETVAGGEIDPRLPFFSADLFADRLYDLDGGRADGRVHWRFSAERNYPARWGRSLTGRIAANFAELQGRHRRRYCRSGG